MPYVNSAVTDSIKNYPNLHPNWICISTSLYTMPRTNIHSSTYASAIIVLHIHHASLIEHELLCKYFNLTCIYFFFVT